MRKRMMAFVGGLLLVVLVVCGVVYSTEASKVKVANQLFQLVFTNMGEATKEVSALDSEEEVVAWLEDRYGAFFTEDGWKMALENRVMLLSIPESDLPQEVEVNIQRRGGMDNCYIAEVGAKDNEAEGTYCFFFEVEKKGGEWLISSISRWTHVQAEEHIEVSFNDSSTKEDKDEEYRVYRENSLAKMLQEGYGLAECKVEMVCEDTQVTEVSVLIVTDDKDTIQKEAEIAEYVSKSTGVPAEEVVITIAEEGTNIGSLAMVVLAEDWSIKEETVNENYAFVSLMYQGDAVASIELGVNSPDSWMNSETTAESFVANYVGMHAELEASSSVETVGDNALTKVVANPGMSAAEAATTNTTPENEVWYFGVLKNDVYVIVQLWDAGKQEVVENILGAIYC